MAALQCKCYLSLRLVSAWWWIVRILDTVRSPRWSSLYNGTKTSENYLKNLEAVLSFVIFLFISFLYCVLCKPIIMTEKILLHEIYCFSDSLISKPCKATRGQRTHVRGQRYSYGNSKIDGVFHASLSWHQSYSTTESWCTVRYRAVIAGCDHMVASRHESSSMVLRNKNGTNIQLTSRDQKSLVWYCCFANGKFKRHILHDCSWTFCPGHCSR